MYDLELLVYGGLRYFSVGFRVLVYHGMRALKLLPYESLRY